MTVVPLGINIVTDSARSGVRDLDALVPAAQRVERAVDKMSASVAQDLRAIEGGAQGASKGFASLGGGQIQNVAFQLGDFATQVGAGTSASVALAQQLPQLLGGFGAVGAVLGAVAAIGIPLASAFFGAGEGAKTLADRSSDLADASERLSGALDKLGQSNRDLVEAYGANAAAMREILGIQADLAKADFGEEMRRQALAISETFGALDSMISTPSRDALGTSPTELAIRNIEAALNATTPAAENVLDHIRRLSSATTVQDQADASLELAQAMADAAGGAQNLTGSALELYRALANTAQAGFSASSAISAAGMSADAAAAQFSRMTDAYREFQRLQALGEAQSKARLDQRTAPLAATEDSRNSWDRGVNISSEERLAADKAIEARARAAAAAAKRGSKRSGGGGGGKSEAQQEAENTARALEREKETRDRIIEGLRFEAEMVGKSDVARRIANETRKAGVDLYSEEGQQIADLVERINSAEEAADRFGRIQEYAAQTGADLFTSAIQGADSFKEALGGVIAQLGQMAAQQAFMTLFMGQGGKGGGIFQSILGSVLGGGMPVTGSFANGTPPIYATGTSNHPGGPAIINDRGGEIVDLPSGARVYPHDVSMRMAQAQSGGSSTHVTVGVEVDGEGSIRAFVKDQVTKSEKRAVRTSVGAVRKGDATSHNFWKRG